MAQQPHEGLGRLGSAPPRQSHRKSGRLLLARGSRSQSRYPTLDTHGPAGSVILWHSIMWHMAGVNASNDVIRQATRHAFTKTTAFVSDERALENYSGERWRDWSDKARAVTG